MPSSWRSIPGNHCVDNCKSNGNGSSADSSESCILFSGLFLCYLRPSETETIVSKLKEPRREMGRTWHVHTGSPLEVGISNVALHVLLWRLAVAHLVCEGETSYRQRVLMSLWQMEIRRAEHVDAALKSPPVPLREKTPECFQSGTIEVTLCLETVGAQTVGDTYPVKTFPRCHGQIRSRLSLAHGTCWRARHTPPAVGSTRPRQD